jgi:hypothetical protein
MLPVQMLALNSAVSGAPSLRTVNVVLPVLLV